jgi:hypothetical protein
MIRFKPEESRKVFSGFDERRCVLRERLDCRFVEQDEFCDLLVGFKKLIRSDEAAVSIRGLLDPQTHARFLIEEEKLFAK